MYTAYCAVIFAIAQLACFFWMLSSYNGVDSIETWHSNLNVSFCSKGGPRFVIFFRAESIRRERQSQREKKEERVTSIKGWGQVLFHDRNSADPADGGALMEHTGGNRLTTRLNHAQATDHGRTDDSRGRARAAHRGPLVRRGGQRAMAAPDKVRAEQRARVQLA